VYDDDDDDVCFSRVKEIHSREKRDVLRIPKPDS
jgi:hypothetical protein